MKESQLENKTAIATNDYVRMVDENGNSVKIKKDSFVAAIRDALPSIISDGETGGGSVLSIINGALKSRTDANLASVLGGNYLLPWKPWANNIDANSLEWGVQHCGNESTNIPAGFPHILSMGYVNGDRVQLAYSTVTRKWYDRFKNGKWRFLNGLGATTITVAANNPVSIDVQRGTFVMVGYEYSGTYLIGFCGRNGFVEIQRNLADNVTATFDTSQNILSFATSYGSYDLQVTLLNV